MDRALLQHVARAESRTSLGLPVVPDVEQEQRELGMQPASPGRRPIAAAAGTSGSKTKAGS